MKKSIFLILLMTWNIACLAQKPTVKTPLMVQVEGGTFLMGNDSGNADEKPVHKVTLSPFYIGKYEVTYGEFLKFIAASRYITDAEQTEEIRKKNGLPPGGSASGTWCRYMTGIPVSSADSMFPVGNISWNDAVAYCEWLSKETGKNFRLPSEAEWEFAARGGVKSKNFIYSGGNNLEDVSWYLRNGYNRTHAVGEKLPNELGIFDMTGNRWEWCADWYGEAYYKSSPEKNPPGPERGADRVIRGGMCKDDQGSMRVTCRSNEFPFSNALRYGFRLAMTAGEPVKK